MNDILAFFLFALITITIAFVTGIADVVSLYYLHLIGLFLCIPITATGLSAIVWVLDH